MIIQVVGQAESGKTSLAVELADRINAIWLFGIIRGSL